MQEPLGHGPDFKNAFGAGFHAGAAPHAFILVNHGITVHPDFNGAKLTGPHTVPESQTPDLAVPLPAVKQGKGTAPEGTVVDKPVGRTVPAPAIIKGTYSLRAPGLGPHYGGNGRNIFGTDQDAGTRGRIIVYNGIRRRGTSGVSAPTAICPCKQVFNLCDSRVFIDIENLGRNTEDQSAESAKSEHEQDGLKHDKSLLMIS